MCFFCQKTHEKNKTKKLNKIKKLKLKKLAMNSKFDNRTDCRANSIARFAHVNALFMIIWFGYFC